MKFYTIVAAGLMVWIPSAYGQTSSASAAALERQELIERVTRLNADVESLLAANAAMQRRMSELASEINALREAQTRAASQANSQEELRRLGETIREVDRKRAADREFINGEIAKMAGAVKTLGATPPRPPAPAPSPGGPERFVEYTVQPGDNLTRIREAHNAVFKEKGFKTVTEKEVVDANPGMNPNRVAPGQKILIPMTK